MKSQFLDKIASVTLNCDLGRRIRLGDEFSCREGDVIAVRVLTEKRVYDQLELPSGRMSRLKPGDVVAGALGHRHALRGYAGRVPHHLSVGDEVNILNLGGVLGLCEEAHPELGPPFQCEVLGSVLRFPIVGERHGVPANIADDLPPLDDAVAPSGPPLVVVAGTCMSAGKTHACAALIQELNHRGLRVHAGKATGVSLRRDILQMEDAGARRSSIFTDLGVVTSTPETAPAIVRRQLTLLSVEDPDLIVIELGDGLMGRYGVDAILDAPDIRQRISVLLLAANDPVAAWGGVQILAGDHDLRTDLITGPATDNRAGIDAIASRCSVPAVNARTDPVALADAVLLALEAGRGPRG